MPADALATIRERFALHPEVELALLFGSTARGEATDRSDVDLAVLASPGAQLALAAELTLARGREVDVLDLARAPLPVLERIVREGLLVREARPGGLGVLALAHPGHARDRSAWLLPHARRLAPSRRRARALMVDRTRVASKLAELADRMARVRRHAKTTAAELAADRDAIDLVAFNLMLAVQAAADIASHLITDEGWPVASSLAESFQRVADQGVVSAASMNAIARGSGSSPSTVARSQSRLLARLLARGSRAPSSRHSPPRRLAARGSWRR